MNAVMDVQGVAVNHRNGSEETAEHKSRRGGPRAGSGRPKMAPDQKRTRMSVGFTATNLLWLREQAQETNYPIARLLNDLVTNEIARRRATDEEIDAALEQII